MATKTINLTGAEVAVTGLDGAHAHIRNDGTEVIYAAKTAGITAGADGVASIPAGQSDTIRGISGAVYLLGTGSVLIQSDDYVASPFKTSAASGGSGADEVARTAINTHAGNDEIHVTAEDKEAWNSKAEFSDIPTELPANGGNADTLDGKHASDFALKTDIPTTLPANGGNADTLDGLHESKFAQNIITWNSGDIKDLILKCNRSGFVFIQNVVTGMPVNSTYWFGIVNASTSHRNLLVFNIDGLYSGYRSYNNANKRWSEWKSFADGGNAATLETHPASDFVLKSDYDALAARVAALEGGTT